MANNITTPPYFFIYMHFPLINCFHSSYLNNPVTTFKTLQLIKSRIHSNILIKHQVLYIGQGMQLLAYIYTFFLLLQLFFHNIIHEIDQTVQLSRFLINNVMHACQKYILNQSNSNLACKYDNTNLYVLQILNIICFQITYYKCYNRLQTYQLIFVLQTKFILFQNVKTLLICQTCTQAVTQRQ